MKFRSWLTAITIVLLALVVFLGWGEIVRAWGLLGRVNLWVLALLVPIQVAGHYAMGEVMSSYLRARGDLKPVPRWQMARLSLELSFVNHLVPSSGASGFSYGSWALGHRGVSAGRATMAQVVRCTLSFVSFVGLVMIAAVVFALEREFNSAVVAMSAILVVCAVAVIVALVYVVGDQARLTATGGWVTRTVNTVVFKVTRGRKREPVLVPQKVEDFLSEIHQEYREVRREKKTLIRPFVWATVANILDVALVLVAFRSLGFSVDPAVMALAFAASSIASVVLVTPGGAGVYETAMIVFLKSTGLSADVAIAGTLLARVVLLVCTMLFGYVFYQATINKYGETPS